MNAITDIRPIADPYGNLRQPPASIQAEEAVLGAILMDNEAYGRVRGILAAEHFSEAVHGAIYGICADLIAKGQAASPITVREFMPPILGDRQPGPYLASLCALAPQTVRHVVTYATMIFDLAQRREMISIADHLKETAYSAPVDMNSASVAYSVVGDLQHIATKACPADTRRDIAKAGDAVLANAEAIMKGEAKDTGVPTGFPDLDRLTGGYRPQTLWIVAGRPGQGKTAYMVASGRLVASHGHGVVEFSLEVSEEQILARHMTDASYDARRPITYQQVMSGKLSDEEFWALSDAKRKLASVPLSIDVASSLTVPEIGARVRTEKLRLENRGLKLGVVFVDHMRFVKGSGNWKGNANKEIGEITMQLKQLAKDEGICVCLLAQLNRGTESREDKRPNLGDLRDSGEIEENADVVAFLYREHYYLIKKPGYRQGLEEDMQAADAVKHDCELILGKNRAGPENTVRLWCDIASSTMACGDERYGQYGRQY